MNFLHIDQDQKKVKWSGTYVISFWVEILGLGTEESTPCGLEDQL